MVKTLLLVEDTPEIQKAFKRTLHGSDIHILSAFNGQEALDILNTHPEIDLIVLDYQMPVMNGIQFLKARALDEKFMKIPVLMCSSYDSDDEIFDIVKRNEWVIGFLSKPFLFHQIKPYLS